MAKATSQAHNGPLEEPALDDVMLLRVDGPTLKEDMVSMTDGVPMLTDFTRRCASVWIEAHGRRFCTYTRRHGPEPKGHQREGTDAHLKRSQAAARDDICQLRARDAKTCVLPREVMAAARAALAHEDVEISHETKAFQNTTQRRSGATTESRDSGNACPDCPPRP